VRYQELEPGGALRGRVRYWRLTDAAAAGMDFEPVLPDGCVELIVHLGDPFCVEREGRTELQPRALLAGPGTAPVRLRPTGRVDVIGVRLEPGEAGALAGVSPAELLDRIPALDAVTAELARDLVEELAAPRAGERWHDVLERRLAGVLGAPDPALACAVARVRASGGRISVDELARAVGLSARQLERRFQARVGLGPKLLARIIRFRHAFALARRMPNLAAVATRAGYFDQAHLVRDFRQFAGAAPSRFLALEHELTRQFAG
jgi:AraC-like DNA-binding protein